jgi:ornithine carbamoyltransferase
MPPLIFGDRMKKDLLAISDLTPKDIEKIFKRAGAIKKLQKQGKAHHPLKGKTLGMIFEKSSTRTRVSFEVGMYQLGGQALFLSPTDLQMGRGETIADTARTLSRYLDGIMIRTFAQKTVEDLAHYATIPVINGLTDLHHPCQALADLFTLREHKGKLKGLKLAFIGDGNNVANSLLQACVRTGMHFSIATPKGYELNPAIVSNEQEEADLAGSIIDISEDPSRAARDADVLYTDVWASMGQETEQAKRIRDFQGFQVNASLMNIAKKGAIFMHCLPAHREEEVTTEVIDGPRSVIFDEAENRMHVQKAVMEALMR